MNIRVRSGHLSLTCLMASLVSMTGCSYLTDFVVINASDDRVEIRYIVKKPADPRAFSTIPMVPEIKPISELNQEVAWHVLLASEYSFDPNSRMVVVPLKPNEALRIEQLNLADKQLKASDFPIEELHIAGAHDDVELQGEQVYNSFASGPRRMRTLTYR